ncbi:MAG: HlyD family type I secretion periplasmic adaptor subunit [Rhodoplanes sp.]
MSDVEELDRNLRRHIWIIAVAAIILVIGLGGWAATTEFAGAVIAPGQVVVNSNHKKVQHPTGGVIGELLVREGDQVNAGDILVRLDDTQTRTNLAIVTKALDEMAARQAREEAERDGADKIDFPTDLLARMDNPDVAKAVNGERRQFDVRSAAREGQRSQLKERIVQLNEEISGNEAQIASKANQIEWITKELASVNQLWAKNLVPYNRVTALEREKERLEGERGQLLAAIAQAKGKITEINLQILQIDQEMRSEVGRDLAEIRAKTAELVEKKVAAEDLLRRVDIRAPIDGTVFQLSVHTVGGVIMAGEVIMLVVPATDSLEVETKVQPQDIDQIRIGQPAALRFTAFNMRTTPELNGQVSRVSADVSEDQKTGVRYFTVRIAVPPEELAKLGNFKIISGMPVEAFIHTTSRTVISYLVRPLTDQLQRAFREK